MLAWTTSTTIALRDGQPHADSPLAYTAPTGTTLTHRTVTPLLALVEPVEAWRGADIVGGTLVRSAVRGMATLDMLRPAAGLALLFERLQQQLLAMPRTGRERYFGATCMLACGHDLFVAVCPPVQLAFRQGDDIHVFPDNDALLAGLPLGQRGAARPPAPMLLHTRLAVGDTLLVASSSIGRATDLAAAIAAAEPPTHVGDACDRAFVNDGLFVCADVAAIGRMSARHQHRNGTLVHHAVHPSIGV